MKKFFAIVLMTLVVTSLIFAQGTKENVDNSLNDVLKKGQFILGLDDSFPPMGFRDENNEIVGFDIDVAKEVCSRLNVKLVCQPIDWNAKEQELNTKQIDCIWNGFTMNEERKQQMSFTDAYVNNMQVVVVKASSPLKNLSDFNGKVVGVQAGSSGADAIEDSPEFKSQLKKVVEFKDYLTALMDLEAGGVDGVVIDLLVANFSIQESGKDFVILSEGLCAEEYGVGFRKADIALRDAVQEKLIEMSKDGSLATIATKWFGADITTIGK